MQLKRFYKLLILLAALNLTGCAFFSVNQPPVDTSYNGAYRLNNQQLVAITPSTASRLRVWNYQDGKVLALDLEDETNFNVKQGFSANSVIGKGQILKSTNGKIEKIQWTTDNKRNELTPIALRSEAIDFQSGELRLRGKLTLPQGHGPFPVVILIHGSESYSAVDHYALTYLLAAKGIAGFKFDKRGTGLSEGEYTQDFPTLSSDVIAAINRLKERDDIDDSRINLAGFSQGGWIAPMVASQTSIHSYMVGFGSAVSVPREDRWGYVKRLIKRGYGEKEIAIADQMNEQLNQIILNGSDEAWDRLFELRDQHIDSEWFKAISGSDSFLGKIAEKALSPSAFLIPNFGWKLYFKWKSGDGPGFNRTYDPVKTLEAINTPSLWLMAGEDSSVPTEETIDVLKTLQLSGKNIQYMVYQGAEHGNVMFTEDQDGKRTYSHYAPSYLTDTVRFFQKYNLNL